MKTYLVSHLKDGDTSATCRLVAALGGIASDSMTVGQATIVPVDIDPKYEGCIRMLPNVVGVMTVG